MLDKNRVKSKIVNDLRSAGFNVDEPSCMVAKLAEAVANAVVDSIQEDAEAVIVSGSSAGKYKIQ